MLYRSSQTTLTRSLRTSNRTSPLQRTKEPARIRCNPCSKACDPDLKRLRRDALDALMTLDRALYAKAFALFDADNPKEADRG